jgi:fermentation-respiration switch protein FrsA (DUF1100 family)
MMSETLVTLPEAIEALTPPGLDRREFVKASVSMYDTGAVTRHGPGRSVTVEQRQAPRPLLFITGDQAHSRAFSEDAYQRAAEPKELAWVPGAGHVDLYGRVNLIPWTKLTAFFTRHLTAVG